MRALFFGLSLALFPTLIHAQAGQPSLRADPGSDYFTRARQLYDAAVAEVDPAQ